MLASPTSAIDSLRLRTAADKLWYIGVLVRGGVSRDEAAVEHIETEVGVGSRRDAEITEDRSPGYRPHFASGRPSDGG